MSLLNVESLDVAYGFGPEAVMAVKDVSFSLEPGEFLGIVGESGCGKSTLGYAITRLLRHPGRIVSGRVLFEGKDLTSLSEKEIRPLRWSEFSLVMQSGMNALNPVLSIRKQFEDTFKAHTHSTKQEIAKRVEELLNMVNIDPSFADRYPHELSGGMKQRVAIALALALNPKLVIMDEPTTALDVVVQRSILQNLKELREQHRFAVIFISHDLGTVLEMADRIAVMYAGKFVEMQSGRKLLEHPLHPYSEALLGCFADPRQEKIEIKGIPGSPPDMKHPPKGCSFAARCKYVETSCHERDPNLERYGDSQVACHVVNQKLGGIRT
ncbi:ABC transporter ATP-binding protein [Pullulanibacillus sp. KACC 23026]|uniref:ABC transporter ATP-binding protein n=1 Tax=Pullulanibacillus sp. KACC 23026 TaxID=3028315 RepID=UPI0023AEE61A|nr:ABC transporter ATP-binding protein [Pullulanibacillus sp. KACC 23026]WEG14738.1 ABC transporter ATP-binding protein [Pullulanibacillus sp. KACC 23026]